MTDMSAQQATPLDEIRSLRTLLQDINTRLRSQEEVLRIRGMGLPMGAMQTLSNVEANLARLETTLDEEQVELRQLGALVATSSLINSSLDLDEVLAKAVDEVIRLTRAERGYLLLMSAETNEMEFRIVRELEGSKPQERPRVSSTILNHVVTTGEAMLTNNANEDPLMQGSETIARAVLRSVMCVPLRSRERIVGAIYVDNRLKAGVFTERELNLLKAFANQIAIAIENATLFSHIQAALSEITEMKELTENVFTSIGSGVITTNYEDMVLTYNPAAAEILACKDMQIIGQPVQSVLSDVTDDFGTTLRSVREDNQSAVIEAEPEIPGRGQIVLSMKLSPLKDAYQETQGVAMVLDDLTEERKREETLNLIGRYLPPGLVENIHEIASLGLGGKRREVTSVFADVCPLSALAQGLPPDEVMELLNTYLAAATEAIHKSNGVIDKYIGTEIMVLFNTQLNPQDNHAVRAVEAALEVRENIVRLQQEMGTIGGLFHCRIGVHTGVATMGNVGSVRSRRNFTAIGDTINLSKRLEENARNGQIIVSEDTLNSIVAVAGTIPGNIGYQELESIQVKGRKQRTGIYEVHWAQ